MTSKPERINHMNCYCHFTIQEREKLLLLIAAGKKNSEIAKALNRSTSTISREIRRNTRERRNEYSAVAAQQRYYTKRKNSVRKYILANSDAAKTVSLLLEKAWSPEQISNRLKYEKSKISVSQRTIYRAIEKGLIDPTLRKKLRYKGKIHNGGHKKSKCGHLNIDFTIHDRPKSVEGRKTQGHWESDTVRGAKWSGCIGTHVERKSRYLVLCKIPNRTASEFTSATITAFLGIPKNKIKSFTVDHGKEFANHRELSEKINCKVYFADPHAPYQRGTNENFNGLLRQFFPKRTSFKDVTQEDVDAIAELLNQRPRKCLGWKTPEEVFFNKSLHLT